MPTTASRRGALRPRRVSAAPRALRELDPNAREMGSARAGPPAMRSAQAAVELARSPSSRLALAGLVRGGERPASPRRSELPLRSGPTRSGCGPSGRAAPRRTCAGGRPVNPLDAKAVPRAISLPRAALYFRTAAVTVRVSSRCCMSQSCFISGSRILSSPVVGTPRVSRTDCSSLRARVTRAAHFSRCADVSRHATSGSFDL